MSVDNEPDDDVALTEELRHALTELVAPGPPPLETVIANGRVRRQRRLVRRMALAALGATATATLAISLTVAGGGETQHQANRADNPAGHTTTTDSTGTIRNAAFVLTKNADGTDTLTLTDVQLHDPAVLQNALEEHGIPALVKFDTFCRSSPAPTAAVFDLENDPHGHGLLTEINPATIPPGTEVFVKYTTGQRSIGLSLIYINSYTCKPAPPMQFGTTTAPSP